MLCYIFPTISMDPPWVHEWMHMMDDDTRRAIGMLPVKWRKRETESLSGPLRVFVIFLICILTVCVCVCVCVCGLICWEGHGQGSIPTFVHFFSNQLSAELGDHLMHTQLSLLLLLLLLLLLHSSFFFFIHHSSFFFFKHRVTHSGGAAASAGGCSENHHNSHTHTQRSIAMITVSVE